MLKGALSFFEDEFLAFYSINDAIVLNMSIEEFENKLTNYASYHGLEYIKSLIKSDNHNQDILQDYF